MLKNIIIRMLEIELEEDQLSKLHIKTKSRNSNYKHWMSVIISRWISLNTVY